MKVHHWTIPLSLLLVFTSLALAQENEECSLPDVTLDKYQYLRALSLDLRGELPSPEEYEALESLEDVSEALIDGYLISEQFADRAVRWHMAHLWTNITNNIMQAS